MPSSSSFKHGVYYNSVPTNAFAVVEANASVIVAVGTAPVHMNPSPTGTFSSGGNHYTTVVNTPLLAFSLADAVGDLGYTGDWANYTLCCVMDAAFIEFNVSPVVFINVLDPEAHCTVTAPVAQTVVNHSYTIPTQKVIFSSVIVQNSGGTVTYTVGTDYILTYNADAQLNILDTSLTITLLSTGAAFAQTTIRVGFAVVIPSQIVAANIIGGVSGTGVYTGLQVIDSIFPAFNIVPCNLIAPGWSQQPTVAAAMLAVVQNINGVFNAMAIIDADPISNTNFSTLSAWKNSNNIVSKYQVLCWPYVMLGTKVFTMSTQIACLMALVDSNNNNVPYASPSNNNFAMTTPVVNTALGQNVTTSTPLLIPPDVANFLNSQGIITATNMIGGWRCWGNFTAAYPSDTDPHDMWLPIARMFEFFGNTMVLTNWQFVDRPANLRLIESVEVTAQLFVNQLVAAGALLGGAVQFLAADNPEAQLLAGTFTWRAYLGGVIPAQDIEFLLQFDTSFLNTLFSAALPA